VGIEQPPAQMFAVENALWSVFWTGVALGL